MPKEHLRPASSPSEVVDAFRAGRRRGPLHPREKLLIGVLGLLAVVSTWLAGAPVVSAYLGFACALAAFIIALMPRPIVEGLDEVDWSNRWRLERLIKFPVFWIGLALIVLIGFQASNPAFRASWDIETELWVRTPLEHTAGAPVGAVGPAGESNTSTAFLGWTSAWLGACAVWVGISRRRSLLAVLWILGLNAVGLAIVGLMQFYSGAERIFGVFPVDEVRPASAFPYLPGASAFFAVSLGLCLGLAVYYFYEAKRFLLKSDPSGLFFFGAITIAAMAACSGNAWGCTAAVAVGAAFGAYVVFLLVWKNIRGIGRKAGVIVCVACAAGFVLVSHGMLNRKLFAGLGQLDRKPLGASPELRSSLQDAVLEASAERPWTGWGAGSLRYVISGREKPVEHFANWSDPIYHAHARNDLLELLAELGRIGTLLVLACAVALGWRLFNGRTLANPLLLFLSLGLVAVLFIGLRETTLSAPSTLLQFSLLLCSASLLAHMEQPARFRAPPAPSAPDPRPWEKRGIKTTEPT